MIRAYLARHLFEGERLRHRALVEFTASLRSGRMIAFVGSYATEKIGVKGYRTWQGFLEKYAQEALDILGGGDPDSPRVRSASAAIRAMLGAIRAAKTGDDALASLSVIEYALAYATVDRENGILELQRRGASLFKLVDASSDTDNNVRRIVRGLGIDRIITLNYDLEFEWELMTSAEEKAHAGKQRQRYFDEICGLWRGITRDDDTGTLTRALPNGYTVISDVFIRDRTDRLVEFAVGSPDQEAHILHLHGRSTDPATMIISQRDYNNQYRRSGVTKLPFERALKMMFAGNPILFVGIGMGERDVTATLEQFVSDQPNRRISPAFILWNGLKTREESDALRFRWLHRFGVLTLFDDELTAANESPMPRSKDAALIMSKAICNLADRSVEQARAFHWARGDLRSVKGKFLQRKGADANYFDVWPTFPRAGRRESFPQEALLRELSASAPIKVFIADPGTGKGALAKALRERWHSNDPEARSSIVNASFVFETDSLFSLISGLSDGTPAADEKPPKSRRKSLDEYLRGSNETPVLVVINGMERFFSPNGASLSVELDSLVRKLIATARKSALEAKEREEERDLEVARQIVWNTAKMQGVTDNGDKKTESGSRLPLLTPASRPAFQIIILGTARVRRYLEALRDPVYDELVYFGDGFSREHLSSPRSGLSGLTRSVYLGTLMDAFEEAGCLFADLPAAARAAIEQKKGGDRAGIRRAVLSAYLQAESLRKAGVASPDLCLDILSVMAFIGQPVEDAVLAHAPRIRNRLNGLSRPAWQNGTPGEFFEEALADSEKLRAAFDDLQRLKLIVRLRAFSGSPPNWRRYGLHRSVLAELRDRHGVPLSDSQLSAGFNLSVFAAQPGDGYSPERELHQELANLADWLIGAYKDAPLGGFAALEDDEPGTVWDVNSGIREHIRSVMFDKKYERAWPHVSACLRAALALMRSYYSTSTLLTLDRSETHPLVDEDGPLTEHADRLDRMLKAARCHAETRRLAAEALGDAASWLAPPPFYGDDLVWLHNERGVVKLAQGDLYEARFSFEDAATVNSEHVEFGDRGQNWRRITFNQIHVDIERGALERAESRIEEIGEEISREVGEAAESIESIRGKILDRYGPSAPRKQGTIDAEYGHETILSVALMLGYKGLCLHLRGHLRRARKHFEEATSVLDNVGEQRAHALFQKYSSSLYGVIGDAQLSDRALRLSIASAEATRQTDVAYHARVSQAWNGFNRSNASRASTLRKLESALLYAEVSDMHRIRIEAGLNLARVKLDGGDYDSALEHAADAMATATRYGLSLRKISLRTLIGMTLIRRGDPLSGRALLERAIRNADRINYQRAVEEAQQVLLAHLKPGD